MKWQFDIEKKLQKHYYLWYTVTFAVIAVLFFGWFFLEGKTLIYAGDGWNQHYKALIYYAKYLRGIIKTFLLEKRLVIPQWDFSIGEGSDIIETLHYYVIGDPFAVLSAVVPIRFMYHFFSLMVLLRMYCAGLAFSALCFYTKKENRIGILAGTLIYVFCFWASYSSVRHPYFLNPMIYYPLIILGIEKIIRKEKPYVFAFAVTISAVSNFYFFYMLVMLTVLYVIVRLYFIVHKNKDVKDVIRSFIRIALSAVWGALMASVLLLPICYAFLSSTRMGSKYTSHLFYPLKYYSNYLKLFVSNGTTNWLCMGFACPSLLAVILLFMKKKKNVILKTFFIFAVVFSLFPIFGQFLNGMSYESNRWSWAYSLIVSYIVVAVWPTLFELSAKEIKILLSGVLVYAGVSILLEESRNSTLLFIQLGLLLCVLIILLLDRERGKKISKQYAVLGMVMISVFLAGYWHFSPGESDFVSTGVSQIRVKNVLNNEASVLQSIVDQDENDAGSNYIKYSGRGVTSNASMFTDLSSTQFYWTIATPSIASFRYQMELPEGVASRFERLDERTYLNALASVKYMLVTETDNKPLPYGYSYVETFDAHGPFTQEQIQTLRDELGTEPTDEQIDTIKELTVDSFKLYQNDHYLEPIYAYDSVLSKETEDELSIPELQEAHMQTVSLKDYEGELTEKEFNLTTVEKAYEMKCSKKIRQEENGFFVKKAGETITFTFEGDANAETYLSLKGMNYIGVPDYDLYFGETTYDPENQHTKTEWKLKTGHERQAIRLEKLFWDRTPETSITVSSSTGVHKNVDFETPEGTTYHGQNNYTINFDYSEEAVTSITLKFNKRGLYTFDNISIYSQPLASYDNYLEHLSDLTIERFETGQDEIQAEVALQEKKILCMAIPYTKGWTAYIDGVETKLYQANTAYMALEVEAGTHQIELKYHSPFLKIGAMISLLTGFVFVIFVIRSFFMKTK